MENQERNMSPEELEQLNKERQAFAEADDIRKANKKAKTKKILLISLIAFLAISLITGVILILTVNHTYVLDYGYDSLPTESHYFKLFDKDIALPNPERDGYTFIGWTGTNLDVPTKDLVIKQFSSGDRSYRANWEVKKYTLTLDADGGEGITSKMYLELGELYSLPTPTKEGHTFLGWFDGTKEFPSSEIWTGLADKTLKAKWEANEYHFYLDGVAEGINVIYDRNYLGSVPSTVTVLNGETLSPWIPTRSGYLFMGWYTDAECTAKYDFSAEITADLTLYAKWVEMTLPEGEDYEHVKGFEQTRINPAAYDSTQNTTEIYSYNAGKCVYLVANEAGSHSIYYRHYSNTPDITVYNLTAKTEILKPIRVTNENYAVVTFDCAADDIIVIIITNDYYYSSNYVEMYFEGFTYPEATVNAPESSLIYTGASGSDEIMDSEEFDPFDRIVNGNYISVDVKYGEEFELPVITRPGYTFDGWSDAYAELEDAEEDNFFEAGKWDSTKNVYLRPSFTPNTYTITFKLDGGSLDSETMTVEYGSWYELPIPTKENYTFAGWYIETPDLEDEKVDDIEFSFEGIYRVLGDIELVAKWEGLSYKVTFENSAVDSYVRVNFNLSYPGSYTEFYDLYNGNILPQWIPTRGIEYDYETDKYYSYVFTGWYTDSACKPEQKYDFAGAITEDMTLYANWKKLTVNVGSNQINPSMYIGVDKSDYYDVYYADEINPDQFYFLADKTGTFTLGYAYDSSNYSNSYYLKVENVTKGITYTNDGYILVDSSEFKTLSIEASEGDVIVVSMCNDYYSRARARFYFEGFDEMVSEAVGRPGYRYYEGYTQERDYVYGDEIELPAMEARTGFKFLGWYNGTTKVESGVWTITSNITLTPKWESEHNHN